MQKQPTLRCSQRIWREGGTAPRTCVECGKGPCKEAEENKTTEYQLVPKEPTVKMVISAGIHHSITTNQAASIYKTMLTHAPRDDIPTVPTPAHWHALATHAAEALRVITGHDSPVNLERCYGKNWWEPLDELRTQLLATCSSPPTQPSTDATMNDSATLHPGHPDYPVLSDEELSNKVTEIAHAIEACGASPELTHAVTLVSDFGYHLRRAIKQKTVSHDVPHIVVEKLVKVADLSNVNARLAANQLRGTHPQAAQRVIGWCDLIDVELKQLEAVRKAESSPSEVEQLKARCRELELALETAQGDAEDQRKMKCRAMEQRSTAQEYIRQLLAELKRLQWGEGAITPKMDAAGRDAVARAEADGCASLYVLCKVYAEAANQAAYSEIENISADVPPKPCPPTARHALYETGDPDVPEAIQDRNGEVALALCKVCGRGEVELSGPCTPPQGKGIGMELHDIPVISTRHLTQKAAQYLTDHGDVNPWCVCATYQDGFFLYLDELEAYDPAPAHPELASVVGRPPMPQCLFDIRNWARRQRLAVWKGTDYRGRSCWVRLDRDADTVPELPTYNW